MARQMKDIEAFKTNPFLDEMKVGTRIKSTQLQVKNSQAAIFDTESGEITSESALFAKTFKYVDKEEFVKIYTNNISSIYDLSSAGHKVFQLVIDTIQETAINKDLILLSDIIRDDFCKKHNKQLSKATFTRGLKDLIQNRILAKCALQESGLYYINPAIIFNGDRMVFINAYEKREKEEHTKLSGSENI